MAEQCKCGSLDFFMEKQGNNTGLYCSMCGKWQKWMNKDDIRLFEHNHKPKARNTIKQTNADRIRSMNDEELAKFIRAVECCSRYSADCGFPFCPSMEGNLCNGIKEKTEQYILDWLQSEVKGSGI